MFLIPIQYFVTFCCLFLYCDNVFISPTDISKVFYQHNYSKAKNPEIFLDTIIENFSDKTTKKYQLTRIWDILDIFRNCCCVNDVKQKYIKSPYN
mgnify:CR=1 FL=1